MIPLLLLVAGSATAHLRCDGRLVERGQTPFDVLERCGPALWEDRRVEYRREGVPVVVDEWLYEPGKAQFRRLLRFENGRLRRVELLSKPARGG